MFLAITTTKILTNIPMKQNQEQDIYAQLIDKSANNIK